MQSSNLKALPVGAKIAVVSPHLDDAVLGCGDLIASRPGATVITAFAGRPASYPALTDWDARAGFGPGDDVVAARREEDRAALSLLAARPIWMNLPDSQYGQTPTIGTLSEMLDGSIRDAEPELVVLPLGLFHHDHVLAADAALRSMRRLDVRWLAYADAIYRQVPNLLDERLETLRRSGLVVRPAGTSFGPASSLKRRAAECYASQLRALAAAWGGALADAYEPEQYWSLSLAESR